MIGNLKPFLDMIAWSEGTRTIPGSDDGYNVLVGSTIKRPILFTDYSTHPDVYNHLFNSTAAGRYQIIFPTWQRLCIRLGETDFQPPTQDAMAASLVADDCHALGMVQNGSFALAVNACSGEWASLPGSTSGQHENILTNLAAVYKKAGGVITT